MRIFFKRTPRLPPSLRKFHEPLIKHKADADIAALEWNPPAPPAVADNVIRRRATNAVRRIAYSRIFLGQFAAVPILHAFPA